MDKHLLLYWDYIVGLDLFEPHLFFGLRFLQCHVQRNLCATDIEKTTSPPAAPRFLISAIRAPVHGVDKPVRKVLHILYSVLS